MKFVYLLLIIFILPLKAEFNNVNLYTEFNTLYYQNKYDKALKVAENYLTIVDDNPNLGDLAALYLRVAEKHSNIANSVVFLSKIVKEKKDYITKERIVLVIADYFSKKEKYYSALKYYKWIERKHHIKSLVFDDTLWNIYLIYKKIGAYNKAIEYLDKIIATHEYAIYVGTYNQFHLYDAYIEKADLLIKKHTSASLSNHKKAIKTLEKFLKNFDKNDKVELL